jgi:hypothetical protein
MGNLRLIRLSLSRLDRGQEERGARALNDGHQSPLVRSTRFVVRPERGVPGVGIIVAALGV